MYAIRYSPGTDLARRFGDQPAPALFDTLDEANGIRRACPNAEHMEVVVVGRRP